MLVLSRSDVEAVLDVEALVDALAGAMSDLSAGAVSMPQRVGAVVKDPPGLLAVMPAFLPAREALTAKLVTLFPDNLDRPTHHALICCFDPRSGAALAVMDGTYITATRTAAGSALATRLLARGDARIVAIVGTGVQARAHITVLSKVWPVDRFLVAGRSRHAVDALVREMAETTSVPIGTAVSIEDAVRNADVVCATTHAAAPVVRREWLRPGSHVNSVGYNSAGEGEVDGAMVHDAVVVVESRDAALAPPPAGAIELRLAIEAGLVTRDHIAAEIGEIVAGSQAGRTDDSQITLYKSVGVAAQDAAAASLVLDAARALGLGVEIDM